MKVSDSQTKSSSSPLLELLDQQPQSLTQCIQSKTSHHVCVSKTCHKYAFVCDNHQCPCKKLHDLCLIMQTNSIKKNLQAKTISTEPLQTSINSTIESITDKFSDFRDKLIQSAQINFQLCGFSKSQKLFLQALNQGDGSLISGEKLWKVIQNIFKDPEILSEMSKSIQRIKKYSRKFEQKMTEFMNQIENEVKDFDIFVKKQNEELQNSYQFSNLDTQKGVSSLEPIDKLFMGSKIIDSLDEVMAIREFFDQKIFKSAEMIYRASENEFLTEKFHEKCDNISQTFIILETQYNKKIGGYTGLKWSTDQKGGYKADDSEESFLFSLTCKDKFTLKRKINALYMKKKFGPVFGGGGGNEYDLFIADKADTNTYSCMTINEAYCNLDYTKGDKHSLQRLTGNQNNGHFKIIEWQVWKIEFEADKYSEAQ